MRFTTSVLHTIFTPWPYCSGVDDLWGSAWDMWHKLVSHNNLASCTSLSSTSSNTTQIIIALALVSLVCGCFQYGMTLPQWAIINCSTELVQHIKTCYVCTVHCSTLLNKMMFRYDLNSGKLQHAKVGIWVYQLQTDELVIYHFLNTTPKLINGELPSTMQ